MSSEEKEREIGEGVLSPEEIRRRRLAYFQTIGKDEAVSGQKETTLSTAASKTQENNLGLEQERWRDFTKTSGEKPLKISVSSDQELFHFLTRNDADKMPNRRTDRPEEQIRRSKVEKESPRHVPVIDGGKSKQHHPKVHRDSNVEPDEFLQLREELKTMVRDDNEELYDSKVERLIQLTKSEIVEREKNSEKSSARIEKSKSSYDGDQREDSGPKEKRESQRRKGFGEKVDRSHFEEPKKVDQVEEFFVKGKDSGRVKSRTMKMSLMESQEDDSVLFQKSLNFATAEELGLSTHRGDTEREETLLQSPSQRRESPRVLQEYENEGFRNALGDRKYQEFLHKSMKEIDHLNDKRHKPSKSKQETSKDVSEAQKQESEDLLKTSQSKGQRKVASVPGVSKSSSWTEQKQRGQSHDLRLNLHDMSHMPVMDDHHSQEGGVNIPRLNRPRHEPTNIYHDNEEPELMSLPPSVRQERPAMMRNVVFSTSQIYQQAFREQFAQMMPWQGGPPGTSPPSMIPTPGRGYYGSSPNVYQSMQYPGSPFTGIPPSSPGFYPPQSAAMATPPQHMIPHPPSGNVYPPYNYVMPPGGQNRISHVMYEGGDNPYHQQLSSRSQQSNDASHRGIPIHPPRVPHPPEIPPPEGDFPYHHPVESSQRYGPPTHQSMTQPPPYHFETMGSQPYSARSSVDVPDFRHYLQQMPTGIPYPPPPGNVDLDAYFKYVGSQGYPVPYPVFIPQQVTAQSTNQTVKPRDTSATDVRGQTDEAFSPRDKLVPHPPAKSKKEDPTAPARNTSPRRNIKHDGVPSQKNSPEPHNQKEKMEQCGNDVIPKKTEQKKREPKIEKQNPKVEQKTLEKMEDLPVMTEEERRDEGSVEELPLPDAPGNINSSQRHVEAIRQYHEQRRQLDAEEDALVERNRKFAKASLERYFTSLEQMYLRREKSGEEGDTESFDKPASVTEEEENDLETNVNTEVTAATSVKAGGITNRIEQLGIDLSFLKKSQDPDLVPQETENKKGDTDVKSKKSKLVVICPECEEINKDYMSWCGNCGEVLIGIEPVSVKKSRGGKISVKPVSKAVLKKGGSRESKFTSSGDNTDGSASQNEGVRNEDSSSGVDAMFEEGSKETKKGKASQKAESNIERSQKEIAEICENITDPIVKGFIKSFLRKKKHDVTSTDVQTDRSMVTDKTSARSNAKPKVYSQKEKPAVPPKDKVKKLAMNQKKRNENVAKKPKVPSKQNVPVDERENDFITQCRSESSSEKEVDYWHHEQGQKNRPDRPLRYKNVPPIDIEVFAMEESRRSSRTSEPIVPSLNLVNSSDEEAERKKENAKIFSMSADSEDWEDFFNPNIPGGHQPAIEDPSPQEEGPQPFLERVLDDLETPAPKKGSKGAKKGPNVPPIRKSIVRESIETPGYQRKWEKSSSVWASRELGTRPNKPVKAQRPASAGMARRVGSEENLLNDRSPAKSPVMSKKPRPGSADMVKRKTMRSQPSESGTPDVTSSGDLKKIGVTMSVNFEKHADLPRPVDHRLQTEQVTEDTELPLPGPDAAASAYNKYHEMTPRIRVGEYSMWLCLPDELLLHVFSFLGHNDLASCARTCQQYHRVAKDPSLWKYITLKKKHDLTDEGLLQIGRHKPVSLALIQCHGENITAKGLREMFRECADSLRELNFCGCSRGALTGDCILLHASARCHNLTHVDASWCNVSDSGVGAISNAANRLESLCINGCQLLSDEGFETVIKKHGKSLRVIEMFGCFNITPKGMRYLANNCVNLTTLNLGQCYKLTDICISQLSSSLGRVENLDLRGCKTIKDNCIRYVVKNCPRLKTISLANCPNISDVSLLEISTYLSDIRSIDVCGCRQVTDSSIRAIANNCQNLRYIDISSTGCTHRSVSMLANFCSQRIETMKLNFLSDLSENCLIKLLKHCKRLQLLHLYGCTSVRNIDKIRQVNPNVKIEL